MRSVLSVVFLLAIIGGSCAKKPANDAVTTSDSLRFLVPHDSIGIEHGNPDYMFGSISSICAFPGGSIGVLDRTAGVVKFYSPHGEYIREFAPLGSGPGEFSRPDRLRCDEHGNIMITSSNDRKMAWFSPEFSLITETVLASVNRGGPMRICPSPNSGYVAITTVLQQPDSVGMEIALFRESEEPEVVYRRRMTLLVEQSGSYQDATNMIFTTDNDGKVYIADNSRDTFSITCFSADGDSLFSIDRPCEPVRRTQEEIDDLTEAARQNWISVTGSPAGFSYEPPEYYNIIRGLAIDGNGRLWVRGAADATQYQVFDNNGDYLYHCSIRMPEWQEVGDWKITINPYRIMASTSNPEMYPVVYMMEEIVEVVSSTE